MKSRRPLRQWVLFGRPLSEWAYLTAMVVMGLNTIRTGVTEEFHGARQLAVLAGNLLLGTSALGLAAATLAGQEIGLTLLWVFAFAFSFSAPMAAWSYGDASVSGAFLTLLGTVLVNIPVLWYGTRRLHASVTLKRWPALMVDHATAADDFVAAIGGMSLEKWASRSSPEAWSPAEITEHLARTYSQFAGEARGKNSLRIRLGPVRRTLARVFAKPRLLAGRPFPKARAPRELRPSGGPATPAEGIALFRATGDGCLRDLEILHVRRPYRRMVHPFLGALPLYEIVQFATLHIRHHHRQLPP